MAPSTYVKQFKVQAGHGGLNSELEQYLFGTFKGSLEKIRGTKYSDDANENREIKKKLFREFHSSFQQYIHTRLSSDKLAEDPKKKGSPKFANEPYMIQLTSEFGFTAKIPEEANFDKGGKYEAWLEEDFNRFMAIKSVKQYGHVVATNVDSIIQRDVFTTPVGNANGQSAQTNPSAQAAPSVQTVQPANDADVEAPDQAVEPESPNGQVAETENEEENAPDTEISDIEAINKFDRENGGTLIRAITEEADYV